MAVATEELVGDARRIMIDGVTGSGKTTLARSLAEVTTLPWHSIDDLTWEPGWIEVTPEEQRRRIEQICAQPEWIIDSVYGKWRDIPLARVELIVALDYPRWFSLQRLVRRTLARVIDRREVCNGNTESVRNLFSRDAIVVWHFRSFDRKRQRIRQWLADPAQPPVLRLRSARETERWLRDLRKESQA